MKFVAPAIVVALSLSVALAPVAMAADPAQATPSALTCDGAWHLATSDNPARTNILF